MSRNIKRHYSFFLNLSIASYNGADACLFKSISSLPAIILSQRLPDFRIIQILNFRKIRTLACCQRKMCALVTLGNRPARPQGLTCNITMWSACWITLIQIFFYYNISFFNVNRKIKFYSDFTLFLHYYTLSQKIFYNCSCNFIIKFHRHNV
mgnify:FL=1